MSTLGAAHDQHVRRTYADECIGLARLRNTADENGERAENERAADVRHDLRYRLVRCKSPMRDWRLPMRTVGNPMVTDTTMRGGIAKSRAAR